MPRLWPLAQGDTSEMGSLVELDEVGLISAIRNDRGGLLLVNDAPLHNHKNS